MEHAYLGREQTLAKHFILKSYLATLAFKLLQGGRESLAYVDGFSGPWQSRKSDYTDTSFMIALGVLKDVQKRIHETKGELKEIKCFFVEDNAKAYKELQTAVQPFHSPETRFLVATVNGKFEDSVDDILRFIGGAFSLTFVDPTGWTGYPLEKIAPLLRRPGEVLVNFMFDHVNRFIEHPDPQVIETFNAILGGPGWRERLDASIPAGQAAEKLFLDQLKLAGNFSYAISTRIEKATANRPHFSITYGTRSKHGLTTFRDIEYSALSKHEQNKQEVRAKEREAKTGQASLFDAAALPHASSLAHIVSAHYSYATQFIKEHLQFHEDPTTFGKLCTLVLPKFILRETNLKDICVQLADEGIIDASWEADKKKKPHDHHLIRLTSRVRS
jgi:three-Cys-motif partner protein